MRGFTVLTENGTKPTRGTSKAAGYDLHAAYDITIEPGKTGLIKTDVAAYMQDDEVFILKSRSGLGYKKGTIVGAGVIDADYYMNPDNQGNIGVVMHNWTSEPLVFSKGEKVAQGVFVKYLITEDDGAEAERNGGFGSTGK